MPRRENTGRRRPAPVAPCRTILVYCGGLRTERDYFEALRQWLLLHHADCRAHCNGCKEAHRQLRRHVPAYDKTRLDFARFAPGVDDAVRRARALDPNGTAYEKNPSTGAWQVVEQIMEAR